MPQKQPVLIIACAGLLGRFADRSFGTTVAEAMRNAVIASIEGFNGTVCCWIIDPDFNALEKYPALHDSLCRLNMRMAVNSSLQVERIDDRMPNNRAVTLVLQLMQQAGLSSDRHSIVLSGAFSNGADGPLDLLGYAFRGLHFRVRHALKTKSAVLHSHWAEPLLAKSA